MHGFLHRILHRIASALRSRLSRRRLAALLSLLLSQALAMASTTGSLPWDDSITIIQNDLTGPVATGVSVLAFLGAGATLIFGHEELGGIAKKLLYVVLGVALIVLGNKFLAVMGLTGALI